MGSVRAVRGLVAAARFAQIAGRSGVELVLPGRATMEVEARPVAEGFFRKNQARPGLPRSIARRRYRLARRVTEARFLRKNHGLMVLQSAIFSQYLSVAALR